jgi:hypothetical protein
MCVFEGCIGWRVPNNNKALISNTLFLLTTNFVLNWLKWFIVGSLDPFIIINVATSDHQFQLYDTIH